MVVRCKFRIDKITKETTAQTKIEDGKRVPVQVSSYRVEASPVYGTNDPDNENSKFWQYTPSGQLVFNSVNELAVAELVVGGDYYLDLTLAAPAG